MTIYGLVIWRSSCNKARGLWSYYMNVSGLVLWRSLTLFYMNISGPCYMKIYGLVVGKSLALLYEGIWSCYIWRYLILWYEGPLSCYMKLCLWPCYITISGLVIHMSLMLRCYSGAFLLVLFFVTVSGNSSVGWCSFMVTFAIPKHHHNNQYITITKFAITKHLIYRSLYLSP